MAADTLPIKALVNDLSIQFSKVVSNLPAAERGNERYKAESEFAWYIHEITAGPGCMVYDQVSKCKKYIEQLANQNK